MISKDFRKQARVKLAGKWGKAILILVFSIIKLIISCFIKNINVGKNKINLKRFIKEVKENLQYPIKKLYIIEFFKGITVHGVLKSWTELSSSTATEKSMAKRRVN